MKCNVGGVERTARIVLGLGFFLAGYAADIPAWGVVVAYSVGGILFLTGAIRFCPLSALFGINTCGTDKSVKS